MTAINKDEINKIVLETIRDYSSDTVYFKDLDSKFIWNSLGHVQQLGASSPDDVYGKTDFDYFPKDFAQAARETELMIIATGQPMLNVIEELVLDDGTTKYYMASKYPLFDKGGKIIGTWGSSKDVTETKTLERELQRSYMEMEHLVRVDNLSGLYNRKYFYETLEKYASVYSEVKNDGSTFSVVLLDVDDLTVINDQFGQQNGDLVLKTIADLLQQSTRKADTCFRIGGDEFAVVLPATDKTQAYGLVKQTVNFIAGSPIEVDGQRQKITISAGIATFDKDEPDISKLLSVAERKVNKSKREGKNQVSF
ncbi:MAG: GGDEF domain-containing protein [Clostridiales bacterium]|nr:GGDEF domain-containing protein [Clostridiales bacterium]MBR5358015.1 GGDEF domain-containing protein [Clostridiales bacterium]